MQSSKLYQWMKFPYYHLDGFGFTTSQVGVLSMIAALIECILQIALVTPVWLNLIAHGRRAT